MQNRRVSEISGERLPVSRPALPRSPCIHEFTCVILRAVVSARCEFPAACFIGALALLSACSTRVPAALDATHASVEPARRLATLDARPLSRESIEATVKRLMAANRVTGLALALIRGGQVAYIDSFGYRDAARALPLELDTVMYGASLTKATFAYFVMQLVDEGRIDLDRRVAEYLPKPLPEYPEYADFAADPRWQLLTARILLNHTSGLANFRWFEPDGKLHLHWQPGTRYGYSGEGFKLLQFVLERGLNIDVAKEMQARVFDRLQMTRTSLTWRDDFAGNFAEGYSLDGSLEPHERREHAGVAGSMDTTIVDWSRFLAAALRGDGLSTRAKSEMIRPTIAIDSLRQFPTLQMERTDQYRAINLGYAVGWGVFDTPYGQAFFKEGHDDGTANYALCVEAHRACILLMSNSVRAEGIYKELVDELMGDTGLPWAWEGYVPYDSAQQDH